MTKITLTRQTGGPKMPKIQQFLKQTIITKLTAVKEMLLKDNSLRGPKALNATNITKIANIVLKNQMQNNQYRDSCVKKCKLEKQSLNDCGCSYRYADSHLYC